MGGVANLAGLDIWLEVGDEIRDGGAVAWIGGVWNLWMRWQRLVETCLEGARWCSMILEPIRCLVCVEA